MPWPKALPPQQVIVPSVLNPHANPMPALTEVKVPAGGVAVGRSTHDWHAKPQQVMVPSIFTPQVKLSPALTEVKVPAGGVAWPQGLKPQQVTVPSIPIPQACSPRRKRQKVA